MLRWSILKKGAFWEGTKKVLDPMNEDLETEIEVLGSTYRSDEVIWNAAEGAPGKSAGLFLARCRPKTGGSDHFVRADVIIDVPLTYPELDSPSFRFERLSGLGEAEELTLRTGMVEVLQELSGCPLQILALIERAEEILSGFNAGGECCVCLEPLAVDSDTSTMMRTQCWHRFHMHCLASVWSTAVEHEHLKRAASSVVGASGGGERKGMGACQAAVERRAAVGLFMGDGPSWRTVRLACPECRHELNAADHLALEPLLDEPRPTQPSLSAPPAQPAPFKFPSPPHLDTTDVRQCAAEESTPGEAAIMPGDLFEVVHYKGNHFRRKAGAWDSKVPGGYVPKGYTGVVEEWDGYDYIRPIGSPHWLALCGRSSGCGQWKMIHIERPGPAGTPTESVDRVNVPEALAAAASTRRLAQEQERARKRERLEEQRARAKDKQRAKEQRVKEHNTTEIPGVVSLDEVKVAQPTKDVESFTKVAKSATFLSAQSAIDPLVPPNNETPSLNSKERRKLLREAQRRERDTAESDKTSGMAHKESIFLNVPLTTPKSELLLGAPNLPLEESFGLRPEATFPTQKKSEHVPSSPPGPRAPRQLGYGWSVALVKQVHGGGWEEDLGDDGEGTRSPQAWGLAAQVADSTRATLAARQANPASRAQGSGAAEKENIAAAYSSALFRGGESFRLDARLLVDYQAILDGHCKYIPNLLSTTMDLTLCERLAADLERCAGEGGMIEWSRHLKHENPTFSQTFQEVTTLLTHVPSMRACALFSHPRPGAALTKQVVQRMAAYFDVDVFASRLNFYRDGSDWKPFHHDSHAYGSHGVREDFTMGASFGDSRSLAFLHEPSGSQFALPQHNGKTLRTEGVFKITRILLK